LRWPSPPFHTMGCKSLKSIRTAIRTSKVTRAMAKKYLTLKQCAALPAGAVLIIDVKGARSDRLGFSLTELQDYNHYVLMENDGRLFNASRPRHFSAEQVLLGLWDDFLTRYTVRRIA
jgi:hypothetical protein